MSSDSTSTLTDFDLPEETPKRSTILFVDPDWEDFASFTEITINHSLNLIWARSAKEAFDYLEQLPVDIMISAWNMRDENNVRLTAVIKSHPIWNEIYTFVLAEKSNLSELTHVMRRGADDVMLKPLGREIFLARIAVALRWRTIQAQHASLVHEKGILQTITTVAHEINNPLFAVLGNLEFLEEELQDVLEKDPNGFIREYLDTISEHGQRIADVVRKLQNITKPVLKPYVGTQQMLDISTPANESSEGNRKQQHPEGAKGEEETFR